MPSSSERLPSLDRVTRLVLRSQHATRQAREYNEKLTPDSQEQLYLAGMNAIAKRFWELASTDKSDPNELRLYADLLLKHFEQKIKIDKIKIMGRHLELLEAKAKALETAVRNARSPAELGEYVRGVLFPQSNGHKPAKEAILIENGVTP